MTGNSRVLAITAPGCRAQWARSRRVMTQASMTAHPSREQIVRGIAGVTVTAAGRSGAGTPHPGWPADGDVFGRDVLVLQRADDMGQGGDAIGDRHAESPGVMIEAHLGAELNLQ